MNKTVEALDGRDDPEGCLIDSNSQVHTNNNSSRNVLTAATALTCLGGTPSPQSDEHKETQKKGEKMGDITTTYTISDVDAEAQLTFPQRLMEILSNEEYAGTIGWLPHGRGFMIYRKKKFAEEVLPKYFRKTKYTSFTRKLNRWNFTRITRGPETGAYYNEMFRRGDLNLCSQMICHNAPRTTQKHSPHQSPMTMSPTTSAQVNMNAAMSSLQLTSLNPLGQGHSSGISAGDPSDEASALIEKQIRVLQQQLQQQRQIVLMQEQQHQLQQHMQQQQQQMQQHQPQQDQMQPQDQGKQQEQMPLKQQEQMPLKQQDQSQQDQDQLHQQQQQRQQHARLQLQIQLLQQQLQSPPQQQQDQQHQNQRMATIAGPSTIELPTQQQQQQQALNPEPVVCPQFSFAALSGAAPAPLPAPCQPQQLQQQQQQAISATTAQPQQLQQQAAPSTPLVGTITQPATEASVPSNIMQLPTQQPQQVMVQELHSSNSPAPIGGTSTPTPSLGQPDINSTYSKAVISEAINALARTNETAFLTMRLAQEKANLEQQMAAGSGGISPVNDMMPIAELQRQQENILRSQQLQLDEFTKQRMFQAAAEAAQRKQQQSVRRMPMQGKQKFKRPGTENRSRAKAA